MNIKKYKFEQQSGAFSCLGTDKKLLNEAKSRGFYNGNTPYNDLFSILFFQGGKLNFKNDLDQEFRTNATAYLNSFMRSFEPSHEEKEAVSALLLSELVELES